MKSLWFIRTCLVGLVSIAPTSPLAAAESSAAAAPQPAAVDALFDQLRVLQLKLDIPAAALEALRIEPKNYVKAKVRDGEKTYEDVGIRIRGSRGFLSLEKRPSLVVKFDEFVTGTLFHGHSRIFLGNSENDPTALMKALAGEIFRAATVPAPKINFARIEINGRDLGLYLIEQAVNREFLSEYFSKTKGNLYEGSNADVNEKLEKDGGGPGKEQTDLKALATAAQEGDPGQRLRKLDTVLDLNRFVAFGVLDIFLWNHKGYTLSRNNYRVYNEPVSGKMVFIPHDLDELFERPQGPLFPQWKGLVARALFETAEGQRRYREQMSQLLSGPCKVEKLHARITELANTVRPALARDAGAVKAFDQAVGQLRDRIALRAQYLEKELKNPPAAK